MVSISLVEGDEDMRSILQLQRENLGKYIDKKEAEKEGFVTAEYTLEFLKLMNDGSPSIIAKDGDVLVGYALVARKETLFGKMHPLLDDLFSELDKTIYKTSDHQDIVLGNQNYLVVGQICVKKGYRSIGLLQNMYEYYKNTYSSQYQYLVTDIAQSNQRSMKAHIKRGFQILRTINFEGNPFDIVLWDWRN